MLVHSPQELAKTVFSRRKQKKLSQANTAAAVGLKQTTLSKFEARPDTTQLATLFRILSSLELEMHILPKKKSPADNNLW